MIQLMGWLVCFYVFIRGLSLVADAGEAKLTSTYYARILIGGLAVVGAFAFFMMFAAAAVDIPNMD